MQDRIARMEMFFLQHATGKAVEKLSPSAIRTISGCGDGDFMKLIDLAGDTESNSSTDVKTLELEVGLDLSKEDEGDRRNSDANTSSLHIECEIENVILEHASSREPLSSDNIMQVLGLAQSSPDLLQTRYDRPIFP